MATQLTTSKHDQRYLGNSNPSSTEVHDLNNEKTRCQIDTIIGNLHAVRFTPDTLATAHGHGYDNCAHCLGGSTR